MARALGLGFLVGFPIAISPGPMFLLVLRRTLARGWRSGLISGLGIATGDAVYAAIAALGIGAVINLLVSERRWIGLAGGIAMAVIGVRTLLWRGPLPGSLPQREGNSHAGDYATTLGLTLSNPPTILSFLAVFAGLGVHVGSGWQPALGLVLGVLLGSTAWWVLLTGVLGLARWRLPPRLISAIGFASGLALIAIGIFITLQAL